PDTTVAPQSEGDAVAAYLQTNGLAGTKTQTNLYYEIVEPGTGGAPNSCSVVQISYRGTLTNGHEFDKSDNLVYNLNRLIKGWIQGLPLIQKGGRIKLYIPPTLAYGSQPIGDIPANSILIFDITLINFQ
ncbi:MAG: FKBP-type peptidylprolyl isomerase, partial [Chitinophagaceae bacterium]